MLSVSRALCVAITQGKSTHRHIKRVNIMARSALTSAIALGLVILVGLAPALTAAAQPDPSIDFADDAPLRISTGSSETAVVVNNTIDQITVTIAVDHPKSQTSPVTVAAGDQPLPAGRSLSLELKGAAEGSGWLVVSDRAHQKVIRKAFTVGHFAKIKPGLSTWSRTVTTWWWSQGEVGLGSLPLAPEGKCPPSGGRLDDGIVVHDGDVGRVHATCRTDHGAAVLDLEVEGFDSVNAGTYAGTLTVGGTDVAISIVRRASAWLAAFCLFVGVLVALRLRSRAARKPIALVRSEIKQLPKPLGLGGKWDKTVADAFGHTCEKLTKILDHELWQRWQTRAIRRFFVPSDKASKLIASVRADTESARSAIEDWNSNAGTEWMTLRKIRRTRITDKLHSRAQVLLAGEPAAMREPEEPDDPTAHEARTGVPGLAAVLAEAKAINTLVRIASRLEVMRAAVDSAREPGGSDLVYKALWRRTHAEARLAVDALLEEVRRTVDAERMLAAGLADRLATVAGLVDQLGQHVSSPVRQVGPDTASQSVPLAPQGTGHWWQVWPEAVQRAMSGVGRRLAASSVVLGDLLVVLITLVVVIGAGLASLYVGKPWGTYGDIVGALIAGAGGSVVTASLLGAVDRLGGKEEAKS